MSPSGQSATPSPEPGPHRGPMTSRPLAVARPWAVGVVVLLLAAACAGGPARRAPTPTPGPVASTTPVPTPGPVASTTPVPTPAPVASATALPKPTVTPTALTARATAIPSTGPAVPPSARPALVIGQPAPAPTDLIRTDGRTFRLADEVGHPTIVFFGYTHCPDVCPETIATLLEVARDRPDVRIVFVTVDPERDTREFLAEWVAYLPDGVVGVTGTPGAIRRAADQYGVQYARVDAGSAAGYAMSHTAFQYLIDGHGVLQRIYPFATTAETIVDDLDTLS
jgi:protein SCO1/2